MTAAPLGAIVRLYVDLVASVSLGDAVVTRTGRTYLVVGVRVQTRGKHAGRQHLLCAIVDEIPPCATVHRISWYRRRRRADLTTFAKPVS